MIFLPPSSAADDDDEDDDELKVSRCALSLPSQPFVTFDYDCR